HPLANQNREPADVPRRAGAVAAARHIGGHLVLDALTVARAEELAVVLNNQHPVAAGGENLLANFGGSRVGDVYRADCAIGKAHDEGSVVIGIDWHLTFA